MANLTTNLLQSITPISQNSQAQNITFPLASDKAKGCGYASGSNGMHTIEYSTTNNCVLLVKIQGSLVTDPTESDWVDINNTSYGNGISPVPNQSVLINFTGNFVWIRAVVVTLTAGQLNRVQMQHN